MYALVCYLQQQRDEFLTQQSRIKDLTDLLIIKKLGFVITFPRCLQSRFAVYNRSSDSHKCQTFVLKKKTNQLKLMSQEKRKRSENLTSEKKDNDKYK